MEVGTVPSQGSNPLAPKDSLAVSFSPEAVAAVPLCGAIVPAATLALCWNAAPIGYASECLEPQPSFSIPPQSICYQGNSNAISLGVVRAEGVESCARGELGVRIWDDEHYEPPKSLGIISC